MMAIRRIRKVFAETIKRVRDFQKQLKRCPDFKWIADSALYSRDKLLKETSYLWLSRVPETITEARALVEKPENEIFCGLSEKKAIKQPHLIQITGC